MYLITNSKIPDKCLFTRLYHITPNTQLPSSCHIPSSVSTTSSLQGIPHHSPCRKGGNGQQGVKSSCGKLVEAHGTCRKRCPTHQKQCDKHPMSRHMMNEQYVTCSEEDRLKAKAAASEKCTVAEVKKGARNDSERSRSQQTDGDDKSSECYRTSDQERASRCFV